jgi:enoyl-CoA hydratase/3-hydroxyacyl-CoA dehydrogenase
MAFELFGRTLSKIGVVGSGNIGPDIALYFSKVGARAGVPVVVTDVVQAAVDSGREKTSKKLQKGVETGAFKPEEAKAMLENITFTVDKKALAGCDMVIEAATERLPIKESIVADLESLCAPTAILASNSSHMEPEVIFAKAKRPERCLVIHYFFPAERNPLVEVVPGAKTSAEVADFCMKFYETIGKVPVRVKSRYGYAVDPIFEGVFQAAALCAQDGLASPKQIDAIAQKALGLGVGPFTAMNLTGGNPITQVGLNEYHEKIMKWFRSPRILDDQLKAGKPWETAGKGEAVTYSDSQFDAVSKRLMGAYFGIAGNIIDAALVGVGDLELAVELGLVMTPPFALMNRVGTDKALSLVQESGLPAPECLKKQAGKPWRVPFLLREDSGDVAVLTIKRPRNLNALNVEVMEQLRDHLDAIKKDSNIKAAVITGFGVKAFVSGADIDMLAAVKSPEDGIATSKRFQDILIGLENLGKPVVCAMNGLAFGGGLELAQACTVRIARPNLKPFAAQPEVKLGIIPGAGGTQRLPRLIGFENASRMLRLGEPITSEQAKEWGLVYKLVDGNIVAEGVRLARDLASGKEKVPAMARGPVPSKLPEVNLGTLSKKIDEIVCRAIVEGAKLPLEQGLELETKLWGDVVRTQDMRIGLDNFKKTALKTPASFIHA